MEGGGGENQKLGAAAGSFDDLCADGIQGHRFGGFAFHGRVARQSLGQGEPGLTGDGSGHAHPEGIPPAAQILARGLGSHPAPNV